VSAPDMAGGDLRTFVSRLGELTPGNDTHF
jgi:hypothetical protein